MKHYKHYIMRYTHEDNQYTYYVAEYQGKQIRMSQEKATGQVYFNSEDFARALGYDTVSDMLQADYRLMNKFLDGMKSGMITTNK